MAICFANCKCMIFVTNVIYRNRCFTINKLPLITSVKMAICLETFIEREETKAASKRDNELSIFSPR